jgi:hypothetical protein
MYGSSDVTKLERGEKMYFVRSWREMLLGLHFIVCAVSCSLGTARDGKRMDFSGMGSSCKAVQQTRVSDQVRLGTIDKHLTLIQTLSIIQICSCSPFSYVLTRWKIEGSC